MWRCQTSSAAAARRSQGLGSYWGMDAVRGQHWRLEVQARPAHVPEIRHKVVGVLTRECPGVDLSAAALVVTELAANVVTHAYAEPGRLEIEVVCVVLTLIFATIRPLRAGAGLSRVPLP